MFTSSSGASRDNMQSIQHANVTGRIGQTGRIAATARAKMPSIPLSASMMLVTLGIVYGDIGTSPMYTLKAIMTGNGGLMTMKEDVVLGALSLIIWTLTLITTVKYVFVAMSADNHNEGGIFALYSLVKRFGKWLIIPAMIGGAALLADGILTPAVTVTTAIEGLRTIPFIRVLMGGRQSVVVIITITIICLLFFVQRSGTSSIGKAFGPIMTVWFLYLGISGLLNLCADLNVLRALNPIRGIVFLFNGQINAAGLMVLGNVFLCTTGAEALYSDMGHVGKVNIFATWPFVKACLILNYLGQGAWILVHNSSLGLASVDDLNPFFQMIDPNYRVFAVILSTLAAIIASQALITGSYSIISEAIHLDLMPHMKINYPSLNKGQIYIPLVNNTMWLACILVVLIFQTSNHMEAAYGLAITATMLMTTILLYTYLTSIKRNKPAAIIFGLFFGAIELMFFFSSLTKFFHGGYFTVLMAAAMFAIMYIWRRATAVEHTQTVYLPIVKYIDQLRRLKRDREFPFTADNIVFLSNDSSQDRLDRDILYSILDKRPKRAKAYWFVNIKVTNEPYTHEYLVENFGTNFIFKVQLRLGFRVNQRINTYLYQIVSDMVDARILHPQHHKYSIYRENSNVGDFRFCMLRKVLSPETNISGLNRVVIEAKYIIRRLCGSPVKWYGLENSSIIFEYVPLFTRAKQQHRLTRIMKPLHVNPSPEQTGVMHIDDSDEDIFSASVKHELADSYESVEHSLIGGDTASFRPLRLDDNDDSEDDEYSYQGEEFIGTDTGIFEPEAQDMHNLPHDHTTHPSNTRNTPKHTQ